MQYYIDGYNLFFKKSKATPSFEKKRRSFLEELNALTEEMHGEVIIVFDGEKRGNGVFQRSHFKNLEVIYTSSNQTADEYILEFVLAHQSPKNLTIVTSDRELAGRSRQLGAATMSIKEFVAFLEKKHRTQIKRAACRGPVEIKEAPHQFARLLKLFEDKLRDVIGKGDED